MNIKMTVTDASEREFTLKRGGKGVAKVLTCIESGKDSLKQFVDYSLGDSEGDLYLNATGKTLDFCVREIKPSPIGGRIQFFGNIIRKA